MNNFKSEYSQLGYYLAGLIEGDGCIWTPKTLRSNNGNVWNPRISMTFDKKEIIFFEFLKKLLGGYISTRSGNTCCYIIAEKHKLIKVINLINGKFRTPKIIALHKAIDFMNIKYNLNIHKFPVDSSDLSINPWLTGIVDSDGCFLLYLGVNII